MFGHIIQLIIIIMQNWIDLVTLSIQRIMVEDIDELLDACHLYSLDSVSKILIISFVLYVLHVFN